MPKAKRAAQPEPQPKPQVRDVGEPYWRSECGRAAVYVGDCLEVMGRLTARQFHAVVTDPPYGLEFMGKEWDAPWKNEGRIEVCDEGTDKSHPFRDGTQRVVYGLSNPQGFQTWYMARAGAMLRVAKPGAHLLSFGGTRMWHRMACAVEDAGWEIRDTIMWVYGSGFPKSHDISKAIDAELGFERDKTRTPMSPDSNVWMEKIGAQRPWKEAAKENGYHEHDGGEAVTDAARQWDGWGTALKPALEPIIMARAPVPDTVAKCVLEHGTGALNIDGCRVGTKGGSKAIPGSQPDYLNNVYGVGMGGNPKDETFQAGRWPANLIHDGSDEVVELFPAQAGGSSKPADPSVRNGGVTTDFAMSQGNTTAYIDSGSAARFFYTAKADSEDRPHGKGATIHPTVKPLDLMRYLVRLVCAPGGTVLDPFMGSGSTGCAAILEGMRFVGIEQSEEYADLAVGRLKLALQERGADTCADAPKPPVRGTATVPPRNKLRSSK